MSHLIIRTVVCVCRYVGCGEFTGVIAVATVKLVLLDLVLEISLNLYTAHNTLYSLIVCIYTLEYHATNVCGTMSISLWLFFTLRVLVCVM